MQDARRTRWSTTSPRLAPSLPAPQPAASQKHTTSREGGQAASSPTQQSGSERRAARCGPGEAAAVARLQAQQRRRGSRAPDRAFVALKSTGSRRRVGTHSCPPSRSVGRSYPPRPHQGGAPQRHRRLRVDASARICRSRLLTTRPSSPNESTEFVWEMTGGAPNPPFFFHTGLTSGLTYGLEGLWRLAQYALAGEPLSCVVGNLSV